MTKKNLSKKDTITAVAEMLFVSTPKVFLGELLHVGSCKSMEHWLKIESLVQLTSSFEGHALGLQN